MPGSGWVTHPCGVTHDTQASTFHHPGVAHCVNPAPHRLAQETSGCPGPIPRLQGLVLLRPARVSGSCGPKCKSLSPSLKHGETCGFKLRIGGWEGPGKEPATLSGSVLGALQTHVGLSPRPAPFTSVGYRCLGGKSRGEQSRWTETPSAQAQGPQCPGASGSPPAQPPNPPVAPKHTVWLLALFSLRHKARPRPGRCWISSHPSQQAAGLGPVSTPTHSPR